MKAIIVAAGHGSRFGSDIPKQYCPLAGRPLLMTTIDAFADVIGRENILLVISREMEDYWHELCTKHSFSSPEIIHGGATRTASVANALESLGYADDDEPVMVHDGARPLASAALIRRMSRVPDGAVGVVPVVPLADSIRQLLPDGETCAADRSRFRAVQTPQTFRFGLLRDAYRAIAGSSGPYTDDASVVEAFTGRHVDTADGDPENIKVTNPMDIAIATAIILNRNCR